ncbi:hypothetical protein V1477_005239 [Vespula maculifrons]|uniref:Uncharacterized protein n=1 Tax=Vespula maculifrons TaxID=7453 RepID=A0ABD2CQ02_VESMC
MESTVIVASIKLASSLTESIINDVFVVEIYIVLLLSCHPVEIIHCIIYFIIRYISMVWNYVDIYNIIFLFVVIYNQIILYYFFNIFNILLFRLNP